MSALFVTGAGTDIGKTYVACALLRAWRCQGMACDALKPVASGYDGPGRGGDPDALLAALDREATPEALDLIAPLRFRAPLAPPLAAKAEGRFVDFAAMTESARGRIRAAQGVLLIEGAGGVLSPLTENETCLDLIAALGSPVLFVSGSYLGAVSHALSGLECLRLRGVDVAAVVVSESVESAGLDETCAMIGRFQPGLAVVAAPRGDAAWADALARILKP